MSKLIVANWKSHKVLGQVKPWLEAVGAPPAGVQLVVMPPATLLTLVGQSLPPSATLGAQNVSPFPLGAYTGEVAAAQLADLGVRYCLVGHSERRQYFGETNELVTTKCQLLAEANITPVVCVDEPDLVAQLTSLKDAGLTKYVLAYEPIGAIGTGHNVALAQVKKVKTLASQYSDVLFLYGGSVSADNIAEYLLICDGALVGTAALDGTAFATLLAVAGAEKPSIGS